jgi:hypothetical protein
MALKASLRSIHFGKTASSFSSSDTAFVSPDIAGQDAFFPAKATQALAKNTAFTQKTSKPVISLGVGVATHAPEPSLIQALHQAIDDPALKPSISPAIQGFDFF